MKPETTTPHILRIDASARSTESVSRALADELIEQLAQHYGQHELTRRDLATMRPSFVSENWVAANFTPEEERVPQQQGILTESDELVEELVIADIIVISMPLYNFSVPAVLKAWIDMVVRARLTFRFTNTGVEGLLNNKPVYVVFASGGNPVGGDMDFASGYLRHVFGFMGLKQVEFISADQNEIAGNDAVVRARAQIAELASGWAGTKQASGTYAHQ